MALVCAKLGVALIHARPYQPAGKGKIERWFRTVSLNGNLFEVDPLLIGRTVTLRYDPAAPPSRGIEVWHNHAFVARASPLDTYANCFVRRSRPSQNLEPDTPPAAPRNSSLALRNLRARKDHPQE